jgi:hypothetical protein
MPWHDAEPWLPVYGTLIDVGCLVLLWRLTRREGIDLFDLVGFQRARLVRDALLGLALIPVSLVFIFAGTYAAGWIVYGAPAPPYFLGGLPLPAAFYGVLVWPFVWGLTEQITYNGYLLPRFQILFRDTGVAIVVVAFACAWWGRCCGSSTRSCGVGSALTRGGGTGKDRPTAVSSQILAVTSSTVDDVRRAGLLPAAHPHPASQVQGLLLTDGPPSFAFRGIAASEQPQRQYGEADHHPSDEFHPG